MRKKIAAGLAVVMAGLVVWAGSAANTASAQDKTKIPPPDHICGHDLKVRPGGESDWPKAHKIGVEIFQDATTKATIAISDVGAIAVAKATPPGKDKSAKWLTAHDLSCRKTGELDFTQKTKKWGVELFRDLSTNRLLYACESGSVALAPVPGELVTNKGPKWHHALEAKVRGLNQLKFDDAKHISMEVFKDENTGGLIYITEFGGIATAAAPSSAPDPKKIVAPKAQYGLVLRVRGADEPDFTEKTKKIGVEVFEDPNTKEDPNAEATTLFYLTEKGYIATAPFSGKFVPDAKSVTWKSAMALRARKFGEDFSKAKKYGIEVFEDNRTGNLIFICETGSIAVLPK
ncbi:MAG: hypothetical protein L0241_14905 [Planctomycetia bacterium]|nr:hypothetical protein [Planctomycetia bacterium]